MAGGRPHVHPSSSCYTNHRCRCGGCQAAHAAQVTDYRQRRKAKTGERIVHGKFTMPGQGAGSG